MLDRQVHPHIARRVNDVRASGGKLPIFDGVQSKGRARHVAAQNPYPLACGSLGGTHLPEAVERLQAPGQFAKRRCPQQQGDLRLGIQQQYRDQGAADRSGGAGNEVILHELQ